MIFDMYGQQGMGYNAIAYALNDMHIPARKGQWSQTSIVNIITNEVYLGKIRWRREPVKKVIKDGFLAKKRITNDDYDLYDGLHEPIITQEQWDLAKVAQEKKGHHSTHTNRELKNPIAGILFCEKCGSIMKRYLPHPKESPTAWYRCTTRGCDCKMVKCEVVEKSIQRSMEKWLEKYTLQIKSEPKPKSDPISSALETVRSQLAGLQGQQDSLCDYLEKGVYTVEMFSKRNAFLTKEIVKLQAAEADLLHKQAAGAENKRMSAEIIPTTQHMLESYPILNPEEKNKLWKLVMKKATVYRSADDKLTINIYPNLPE